MKQTKTFHLTQGAVIAALYVILTEFSAFAGLDKGLIQIRLSEALCILPLFTPTAIPALFIGCFISNIITGCILPDIIFGSLATLLGATGTYFFRNIKPIAFASPIIANTVIVPLILKWGYGLNDAIPFIMLTVGIGEIISIGFIGNLLYISLKKYKQTLFSNPF